jgi:PAP2 superfamily
LACRRRQSLKLKSANRPFSLFQPVIAALSANSSMTNRYLTPGDKLRFGIIGFALLVFFVAQLLAPLPIEWISFAEPYFLIAFLAAIGLAYRGLNRDEGIAAACFVLAQIFMFVNVGVLDNYLGLALRRPLIDECLAGVEHTLGLDWWAYVNWVKSDPFFGRVLTVAYSASSWELTPAIVFLGFTRRFAYLDRVTLAFMLAGSMTIAFWVVFPNLGALPLHYAQGLPEPAFGLAMSRAEAMQQLALFAGPVPTLRFSDLMGIIGCPSFHTVMIVLTVYAVWELRFARTLAFACNFLVLLSIPADGGHHFIDVAGGFLVALASIALADALLRQAEPAEPRNLRARQALIFVKRVLRLAKV